MLPPPPASGAPDATSEGLPKRFGKYTLLRKLATGGMAELFLALQKSVAGFEKLIVIKRILPQMNTDKAFIDMLLSEARIAATLSHPNIVQIFDVGQVDGTYFIAMEHVHGEDIRSIVRQMKTKGYPEFPMEHALSIVLGMCSGLAYAHEKRDLDGSPLNIVHRDISPQNVVVTFSGDVKIVDFGIAKSDSKHLAETKSGKLKGKVPYMSPEQARGEKLDARSDVFATGVMLFELTTGKRLFKGASEYETLKLICDRDYPWPSQVRQGYPPELERIVMTALSKNRDERYQTARQMQAMLEEFIRHERIAVSPIHLQQFMQTLFEDKLASQKEALLQGKQLAEIIELQHPTQTDPPPSELDMGGNANRSSGVALSMPAASRTVTDVGVRRARRGGSAAAWAAVALGLVLIGGGAGGAYWYKAHHGAAPAAAPAATQQAPDPAATMRGAVAVTSQPPGAAIWIDGQLEAQVTPATIDHLPLGTPVEVKLTKDGFEPVARTVTLSDGPPGAVDATLQKGTVSLDVAVSPNVPGVVMTLDGKKFSGALAGLSSGDQHRLVVDAPGYVEQTTAFIAQPQEKKHVEVTLAKDPPHHGSHGAAANAPPPAPPPAAGPSGAGKLNVGASGGWCNVAVDGKAAGPTPVAGIELPSGAHKVTCTTQDGKTQTASVVVPANDTARYRFSL